VRVTSSERGLVVDGASDGRGAWLCRGDGGSLVDASCLDVALSRKAFARAWRRDLDAEDERAIRSLVGRRADDERRPDAR
jgi:predicted RNA-binding protein YlxR (DUF448 family)